MNKLETCKGILFIKEMLSNEWQDKQGKHTPIIIYEELWWKSLQLGLNDG